MSLLYVIVGDEAFPLEKYLMRPYPRSARRFSEVKIIFNYRLSRSKNTVENAFGILTNTWKIYHRPLKCRIELDDKVVLGTVSFTNIHVNRLFRPTLYLVKNKLK